MSQLLIPVRQSRGLSQDIILFESKKYIPSSASRVLCVVCNKGLEDGYSIAAKPTSTGTLFFCERHY